MSILPETEIQGVKPSRVFNVCVCLNNVFGSEVVVVSRWSLGFIGESINLGSLYEDVWRTGHRNFVFPVYDSCMSPTQRRLSVTKFNPLPKPTPFINRFSFF